MVILSLKFVCVKLAFSQVVSFHVAFKVNLTAVEYVRNVSYSLYNQQFKNSLQNEASTCMTMNLMTN